MSPFLSGLSLYEPDPCLYSWRSPYHGLQAPVKLWREEPVLGSSLLRAHSRHLPTLGCKFVAPLLQEFNPSWSLQQEPSISQFSDSSGWGCISGFEVPYNLSGSYPKETNSDLRMLYSVIIKTLGIFCFPLSLCYPFSTTALRAMQLCAWGVCDRRSWEQLASTRGIG